MTKAPDMFAIGSPAWPGLSKLSEESGEVVQVIGKLMGTGGAVEHWDGTNLRQRIIDEIGDVVAACEFVAQKNGFVEEVKIRALYKLELFNAWHAEHVDKANGSPVTVMALTPVPTCVIADGAAGV